MTRLLCELVSAWPAPGATFQAILARKPGEETLLAFVMFACLSGLVLRLPRLLDGAGAAERIGPAIAGALIFAPLFFYGLAAASALVLRLFGRRSVWRQARLALFWSLLAVQPLAVIGAILSLFGLPEMIANTLTTLGFLYLWGAALVAIARP